MNVGVVASGVGTNLQALIDHADGQDGVKLVAACSDRPDAPALTRARAAGIPAMAFARARFADRAERDAAMARWLLECGAELVVLAGYMQLVTPEFLATFPDRVINVHPALLPAFPGLRAVAQAPDYGVKVFGVTVHFVDSGVDTGPIISQRALELPDATDPGEVRERLAPIEHELLSAAVRLISRGAVGFDSANRRRVVVGR